MGTLVSLFQKAGAKIPDGKKEEFQCRVEKLFQAGGMMEVQQIQLCGKHVRTLKKVSMGDKGMDFYYNYFEDDCWESAGFSLKDCSIWSNKIGWREFHRVIVAAYILESLYLDGPASTMVNGEMVVSSAYTGWINYLFHENYLQKNNDPWMLFEALHYETEVDLSKCNWEGFVQDIFGLIGFYEIRAVLSGTDAADEEFDKIIERTEGVKREDKIKGEDETVGAEITKGKKATEGKETIEKEEAEGKGTIKGEKAARKPEISVKAEEAKGKETTEREVETKGTEEIENPHEAKSEAQAEKKSSLDFFSSIKNLKKAVKVYHEESKLDKAEQLSFIMEMLRLYYGQESMALDISKKYEDKNIEKIRFFAALTDAPAYAVKAVSEIYDADFWELWGQVKDVAQRRFYQDMQENSRKAVSVSTIDFLDKTPDDMILFWEDGCDICFSQELKQWFACLKEQYDIILEDGFAVEKPLYWILDLMEYADENYYCVYTFTDFFEETLEHLADRRYLALWKIYDRMLHDPEMEKAGDVIFVPDGPEYDHIGLHYFGTQPRRRLKKTWRIMEQEERDNKARVTFRRYMALMENKGLRKKVFGI